MFYATNQKHEVFAFTTSEARNAFVSGCVSLDTWAISREKAIVMMNSYIVNRAASLSLEQFRAVYDLTLTAGENAIVAAYGILR